MSNRGEFVNIHLLHSNDVHSQLENHMKLGRALRALRKELTDAGEPVLTFDIGDAVDRVRPETEATLGEINAAMLAALGYDGWVFGNNEGLTIPYDHWNALVQRSRTTVFGTNLRHAGGGQVPGFVDWKIYSCGGVRVGVFGLTPSYDKPYEHLPATALPPMECAEKAVAELRGAGCDVVVVLSHLGIWNDRELAARVPGIDVILGGHSHTFMDEPEFVSGTAIFQAGKHGEAFGHTTITYDEVHRKVLAVDARALLVSAHDPLDTAMLSAYQSYLSDVDATLDKPVAALDSALPVRFDEESLFPNALADALLSAYPCDMAIMMAGALNASLLPGVVTRRHVLGACSTPTRALLMSLKGSDVQAIVQKSIRRDYYCARGRGYGFRGSVVGYLALAGATAVIHEHTDDRATQRVLKSLFVGGQEIVPDDTYRIVTCEYLWLSPLFPEFQRGWDIDIRPSLVREVLIEQMAVNAWFARAKHPRYHVVR
jgi:5'-nucleotidase